MGRRSCGLARLEALPHYNSCQFQLLSHPSSADASSRVGRRLILSRSSWREPGPAPARAPLSLNGERQGVERLDEGFRVINEGPIHTRAFCCSEARCVRSLPPKSSTARVHDAPGRRGGYVAAGGASSRASGAEVGILLPATSDDTEFQARVGAFLQGLALLGWTIGRNARIGTRWATASATEIHRHAAELA